MRSNVNTTILCAFFMLMATKQYAQLEKGTAVPSILLFGSYNGQPYKDSAVVRDHVNFFSRLNLSYGKFIKENLLLSVSFTYSHLYNKTIDDLVNNNFTSWTYKSIDNTQLVGAGLGLMRYKFLSESFAFTYGVTINGSFGEGTDRSYTHMRSFNTATGGYDESEIISPRYHNSVVGQLGLNAGIQYFLTKKIALTGSMGFFNGTYNYSPYNNSKKIQTHLTSIAFNPGFNNFGVGITYYLRPMEVKTDQSSK